MTNLVEIGPVVLKSEFLNIFNIILLFLFFLPFEKGMAFLLNNFDLLHSRIFCVKLVEIDLAVLNQKIFKYIFDIILLFCYYLPLAWRKVWPFINLSYRVIGACRSQSL